MTFVEALLAGLAASVNAEEATAIAASNRLIAEICAPLPTKPVAGKVRKARRS